MPRAPRLHLPGGTYHVMLRGNGGQAIFFRPADRRRFYALLEDGIGRFGHRLHGFCLMPNHVHLVVQVAEVSLAPIMQNLSFRYTRYVNFSQARAGHLFQGRYKALLVDAESYLLELLRYVHLNPVRAGLARRPEAYRWSGHRAYLGLESLSWLTTDAVLERFARRRGTARKRYAGFVAEGMGGARRAEFHRGIAAQGVIADDAEFLARLRPAERAAPPLGAVIDAVCAHLRLAPKLLGAPGKARETARARALIAFLAVERGAATLSALAARFGRDLSTLSRQRRELERRLAEDPALARTVAGLRRDLARAA